jgi:hypothetical protein
VDWPWHKDYDGKRCAYVELDATGVRRQGDRGGPAEGRMAYVGMVCNPGPEWPRPEEKPGPMRARYLSGLYPLEEFAPLLRAPAGHVGMGRAGRRIGPSDGGNGLEDRLREDFPRVEVIILDFFHPAEELTGLSRLLYPEDEDRAEDQARRWRQLLKDEGGVRWAPGRGEGPRRGVNAGAQAALRTAFIGRLYGTEKKPALPSGLVPEIPGTAALRGRRFHFGPYQTA